MNPVSFTVIVLCAGLLSTGTGGEGSMNLELIQEDTVLLETADWDMPRPYGAHGDTAGELLILLSGPVVQGNLTSWDHWGIRIEEGGPEVIDSVNRTGAGMSVSFFYGDGSQQWLSCIDEDGDTLWSCPLVGTDDFDNAVTGYWLDSGDFAAVSHPDCWSTSTYIARLSDRGDMLWHGQLTTNYLLDMGNEPGEIYPKIRSVRETSSGDLLVCGTVSEWANTPSAMFIALLDGDSGEPIWKYADHLLGEACAWDAVQLLSGGFAAVGSTSETVYTDEYPNIAQWGNERPFVATLDEEGNLTASELCRATSAERFTGVIQPEGTSGELVILGSPSFHDPVRLVVSMVSLEFR
ncbi:MAG TPA: hypothetical protein PK907_02655 [Candidatus Sabulitectum sp.]|nr:hypothetical protein [Candidatus Sabulitectum sp.]